MPETGRAILLAALEDHKGGRLDAAERGYRAVLAAGGEAAPEALRLLGLMRQQAGRLTEARLFLERACRADPNSAEAHVALAGLCLQEGRAREALALAERAVALRPSPAVLVVLGRAQEQVGLIAEAARSFRAVTAAAPEWPAPWTALGLLLAATEAGEEARAVLRRAVALDPHQPDARITLGLLLARSGQWSEALDHLRAASMLAPADGMAWLHRATTASRLGHGEEALDAARAAHALLPEEERALELHLTQALALGRPAEAEALSITALERFTDRPWPHKSRLQLLLEGNRLLEAEDAVREARARFPDDADLAIAEARLRLLQLRWEEAEASLASIPVGEETASILARARSCFGIYRPAADPEAYFAEQRAVVLPTERETRPNPLPQRSPDPERVIRIGYLGSDFHDHPVGRNILPLFTHRPTAGFEITCYAIGQRHDHVTDLLRGAADRFVTMGQDDDAAIAERIRADGIDILVALASHFDGNRPLVMVHRPAPIQVSFHDPLTSGVAACDYLIGDPVLNPRDSRERFTERPVRLPVFYCRAPLEDTPDPVAPPADGPVRLGFVNNPLKLSAPGIAMMAAVLRRQPRAVLAFKYMALFADPGLRREVARRFREHGIAPERLEFAGRSEDRAAHFRFLAGLHLALDSLPFSGSTTTFECLWMGVPVLTVRQPLMAGRWTAAMLHAIGRRHWVAASPEAMPDLVAATLADPAALAAEHLSLRPLVAASALCAEARHARHLHRLYRALWRRWCRTASEAG